MSGAPGDEIEAAILVAQDTIDSAKLDFLEADLSLSN